MGEHLRNPAAVAKQQGAEMRNVMHIGNGCGLAGFDIQTVIDSEGVAHAVLVAIGGKVSSLVPMKPTGVVVAELGKISLAELHRHFGAVDLTDDAPEAKTNGS